MPASLLDDRFYDGQAVKLIFRPEDVLLSKTQEFPVGHACLSGGVVEEISFGGAYERLRIRLEATSGACETSDTPFYLTTETPERSNTKPVIATRPKPETNSFRLRPGDRVFLGLSSFTILPNEARTSVASQPIISPSKQ
jgi:hypothetical protein